MRFICVWMVLAACRGHAPADTAPPLAGVWLGTLGPGLRVQLQLDLSHTPARCTLDSLDQGTTGLVCEHVVFADHTLSLDIPAVHGSLHAKASADRATLDGTWTQGGHDLPLVLARQPRAIEAAKPSPPVALADLPRVLDSDLAPVLASGELAPATGVGAVVGVIAHGERRVLAYGAAKPDTIFEIGSITKTFTGLLLAQLAEHEQVRLDEPVRALLPADAVPAAGSGAEITLEDLSVQRSGLPRLPDNLQPADRANPYADYDAHLLYAYLGKHGLARPARPEFGYSNLGVGLLGHALATRAHKTYDQLLATEIFEPLGMHETAIALPPALRPRLSPGHDDHDVVPGWDIQALAGAGAIRSTAGDMLTYLDAQLHPPPVLAAAIAATHELRGDAGPGQHIGLGWIHNDKTQRFWHNGGTGGFSSYATFDPAHDFAVIVLVSTSPPGGFADRLGEHVAQRLAGGIAIPLASPAK